MTESLEQVTKERDELRARVKRLEEFLDEIACMPEHGLMFDGIWCAEEAKLALGRPINRLATEQETQ